VLQKIEILLWNKHYYITKHKDNSNPFLIPKHTSKMSFSNSTKGGRHNQGNRNRTPPNRPRAGGQAKLEPATWPALDPADDPAAWAKLRPAYGSYPISTFLADAAMAVKRENNGTKPVRVPQPIIFSICIPRVFKNISEARIRSIMYSLEFGFVERVDMAGKTDKNGNEYNVVFVHFSNWNNSQEAMAVREKLEQGNQVKIVYDTPWYWMISMSHSVRKEPEVTRPKAYIDLSYKSTPAPAPAPECEEANAKLLDDDIMREQDMFIEENDIHYIQSSEYDTPALILDGTHHFRSSYADNGELIIIQDDTNHYNQCDDADDIRLCPNGVVVTTKPDRSQVCVYPDGYVSTIIEDSSVPIYNW
jgi:hypothetical protein